MEKEKLLQAIEILRETDTDLWLIVDRESGLRGDPIMDYVVGTGVTWLSFFLVFRSGETYAIVGNLDIEKIRRLDLFHEVSAYKGSPREDLLRILHQHKPRQIALDYSVDCAAADGLTYGQYLALVDLVKETPFAGCFVSAEGIQARLRGRKSPAEIAFLRNAAADTVEIFHAVTRGVRPGMTEQEVAALINEEMRKRGLRAAWEADHCPSVFSGPQTVGAHSGPTDTRLQAGHIFNIDFGVYNGKYCSDLQRTWYILQPGEGRPPVEVQRGFDTVLESVRRAKAALRPGVTGIEIDRIARGYIVSQGYEEYPHALGHQVGRVAHDGGAMLAPDWERYGRLPFMPLEKGQVFTIEPRIYVKGYGVATIEEMVVITETGAEYLSTPQEEIYLIRA